MRCSAVATDCGQVCCVHRVCTWVYGRVWVDVMYETDCGLRTMEERKEVGSGDEKRTEKRSDARRRCAPSSRSSRFSLFSARAR